METKSIQKVADSFACVICDYYTSKKSNITKHLLTSKHLAQSAKKPDGNQNVSECGQYKCDICKKSYTNRSGLWKHKKTCKTNEIITDEITNTIQTDVIIPNENEIILSLVKQNSDIMKEQSDLKNLILEIVKNGLINNTNNIQNMTNIQNNNQITNNKSFNLNFFLNETCKNAMNIDQFIDTIKLEVADFMHIGEVGFVQGVSDIILKFLNSLDITLRPVHCTDKKREVFYVKDGDKWEKEDVKRVKLVKIIRKVMDKNCRMMPKFREKHPDCIYAKSIWSDSYSKMVYEAMGGKGDDNDEKFDKIIRNIAKEVTIDKSGELE